MTCEHIKEAIRLIDEARTILNWKDDINILGDAVGGAVTLGFWSTGRFASNLREATRAMREANNLLSDAKKSLSICKCLSEARKNNELEIKELWIESAESRIRQLQEENLEEKLTAKKEDLDRLLQELTITGENKKSIKKDLCENYEKLLSKELPVHIKKTLEDNNEMIRDILYS